MLRWYSPNIFFERKRQTFVSVCSFEKAVSLVQQVTFRPLSVIYNHSYAVFGNQLGRSTASKPPGSADTAKHHSHGLKIRTPRDRLVLLFLSLSGRFF